MISGGSHEELPSIASKAREFNNRDGWDWDDFVLFVDD